MQLQRAVLARPSCQAARPARSTSMVVRASSQTRRQVVGLGATLAAISFAPPAQAGNRGDVERGLRERFSDPGGHVIITSLESIEPVSVDAAAVLLVPDVIRWVLENKGIQILTGDVEVGHKTVSNWKKVGGIKIPLGNTYIGYAGWKP